MIKSLFYIFVLTGLFGAAALNDGWATGVEKSVPRVDNGVLDLRNWDFGTKGTLTLSGEWLFTWQKHLAPGAESGPAIPGASQLIKVPGTWNGKDDGVKRLAGAGFATYRLKIRHNFPEAPVALKLIDMGTAYAIYINGRHLVSSGTPGTTAETSIPRFLPTVAAFRAPSGPIDILIHVSNFHHRSGGMWESIKFGRADDIRAERERSLLINAFLTGSILIIGLYHIGLFWHRQDDRSSLYFGLFCMLIVVRLLTTGERYLVQIMPELGFEALNKAIYLSFYLCVPMFAMYARTLFPHEISKGVVRLSQVASVVLSALVVLLTAKVYTHTMPGFQLFTFVLFCYGIGAVIRSVYRRHSGAVVFLGGFLVFFLAAVNDILYTRQIVDTGHFIQIGFFVFIFSQAVIISKRFSMAFAIIEAQGRDLKTANSQYQKELEERKQAEIKLKESERKYRLLAENASDVIWTTDLDLNYTYISPAIEKMHGWNAAESRALTINDVLPPPALEVALKRFEMHVKNGAETGDYQIADRFEFELYCKDGTTIWAEIAAAFILGEEGEPVGILGVTRDISERKQLESDLHRAQKMEAIGTLAGGVAHDLNNVLSAQVSYPDILLMELPADSPLRKPILTIQQSGKKAAAIVQDLLTLARRGVVCTEVVNLNAIIDDYIKSPECESLLKFHPGARIDSRLDPRLMNIMGSPLHLSTTVMNMVSNAAEAMPAGGRISIVTRNKSVDTPISGIDDIRAGEYAVLMVSDTGSGIAPKDLEKIFEPFYTKKVMGRSGTGLGMAVVWGTVKDHKGFVEVQSTEGQGTTFTLYFPVTRQKLGAQEDAIGVAAYMGNGASVLVVDDVAEQREIAFKILSKLGYAVTSVASGEAAVDYLKNNSADLVVLDMIMDPGMDGLETYRRIVQLHPGQKAILASGYSETAVVRQAQAMGAGEYLKKPYTLESIGLAVRGELDRPGTPEQGRGRGSA